MCGRYTITKTKTQVEEFFNVKIESSLIPNYNIAPTDMLPVITNKNTQKIKFYKWGLIPYFFKDTSMASKMINSRAETIFEKPSFKMPIRTKRCCVISDGYYEWKSAENGKQPYYIYLQDNSLYTYAGIWDQWKNSQNQIINTFSIITKEAENDIGNIHHRMPIILKKDIHKKWLSDLSKDDIYEILNNHHETDLRFHAVSKKVNTVNNNDIDNVIGS